MKKRQQHSQTNTFIGIGAITVAVIAGYFGFDYFSGKPAAPAASQPAANADYAAVIAEATENAAGSAPLTADEARRIGEEVARQVAAKVAQSIVDQKITGSSGGNVASGGLSEADARRIGEEEGRRVAQEVAAVAVQQALAAAGGNSQGGLSAAEAEQIGLAAGRRAAQQVAAATARNVVQNEFGGQIVASASSDAAASESTEVAASEPAASGSSTSATSTAGSDALHAWWTTPDAGDFGLVYAGQPKGETAIALLFSEQPGNSALNDSIKVYDAKGSLVSGSWESAANPRLAVLRGLQPGRYTVVVEPALTTSGGKSLNKAQHGPVYVI